MKYATAITLALLLGGTTGAAAHARHPYHHRHHHRSHTVVARSRPAGHAGNIRSVDTKAGPIRVASAYASRFVGFINALVDAGYKPHEIGCYARGGHMPHSKHYRGMACDIDQDKRNVTAKFMYHVTELAHQYKLTDGCEWRDKDCGHIEVPGDARVARHTRLVHHHRYHYVHV